MTSRLIDFDGLIDPVHAKLGLIQSGMVYDIWKEKYRYKDEADWAATAARVVKGVYARDPDEVAAANAQRAITAGLFAPGGRILAGAGTAKRVTLMNCYVTGTIEDSMEGIMLEHTNFALTMQQGGGDGADFSPIRPEGAVLTRTGTKASGPLPFMDMWNSMCTTIRSAGDRRGAMMATLSDTHPDLPKFIVAKQQAGRLKNFNVSVLVSDAFMSAVAEDEMWLLHFHIPPVERDSRLEPLDFEDDDGVKQYVYSIWKARELWEMITRSTYEYAEPGVIFIDQINELNNLQYCETIRCTNPCGEQPLPPHGACDLGHVNLARMVRNPFTAQAEFDFSLLKQVVDIGVRFLDNVIDVTNYPLPEQQQEQTNKRRIGLGFTGLADAFAQLGIRYGSMQSATLAEQITSVMAAQSYRASVELAKERGPFPLFDAVKYLSGSGFAATRLPETVRESILKHGIRNGVLNTIAPVGTVSIVYGNCSSGLEPIFAHTASRKVLQPDNTFKTYTEPGYAYRLYHFVENAELGSIELPNYMVTTKDLSVHEHILIMSRVQRWIDASVSKTINVPKEMPYDDFVQVYLLAYTSGCKGCTTYRPSDVRGSILDDPSAKGSDVSGNAKDQLRVRPDILDGRTYKIKWPNRAAALYLTINSDENGLPFEILISSKDSSDSEWTTALSLMMTAIFRKGGDVQFIPTELKQIQSVRSGAWIDGKYIGSLPAYIGKIIGEHLNGSKTTTTSSVPAKSRASDQKDLNMMICKNCGQAELYFAEGCKKCGACGFAECG